MKESTIDLPLVGMVSEFGSTKLSEYWREKILGLSEGTVVDVRLDSGRVVRTTLRARITKAQVRVMCWVVGIVGSYATGRVRPKGGWDREIKRTARAAGGSDV